MLITKHFRMFFYKILYSFINLSNIRRNFIISRILFFLNQINIFLFYRNSIQFSFFLTRINTFSSHCLTPLQNFTSKSYIYTLIF
uniref:Uncharacterized protein n=1 Tax=Acetobacter pasteurianus TaxID=438 RepID=A9IVJ5_ACEPA|nr:hypothetical protein [Acetobacter pasteurianus]